MTELEGLLHDGSTSRSEPATLRVYQDGTARVESEDASRTFTFDELRVPPRLGNTPRRIGLPDGSELECSDNDAIDAMMASHGRAREGWLHRLESRLGAVVVATVVALVAGGWFAVHGIPVVAREAAFALSPELDARLGQGALEVLDQRLEASQLPDDRREELSRRFAAVVEQAPERHAYALVFRGGGSIGANAFALPDGTVLLTDELVALAEHDDEIVAVMAHEVGHVVHRHGLRQAIQSSLVAIAIVLVSGDLSSTTGFVAALPAALAESRFSRDFEREADDYALAYLEANDIPAKHFADLLRRLEAASGAGPEIPFLASHPSTDERVERLGEGHAR